MTRYICMYEREEKGRNRKGVLTRGGGIGVVRKREWWASFRICLKCEEWWSTRYTNIRRISSTGATGASRKHERVNGLMGGVLLHVDLGDRHLLRLELPLCPLRSSATVTQRGVGFILRVHLRSRSLLLLLLHRGEVVREVHLRDDPLRSESAAHPARRERRRLGLHLVEVF